MKHCEAEDCVATVITVSTLSITRIHTRKHHFCLFFLKRVSSNCNRHSTEYNWVTNEYVLCCYTDILKHRNWQICKFRYWEVCYNRCNMSVYQNAERIYYKDRYMFTVLLMNSVVLRVCTFYYLLYVYHDSQRSDEIKYTSVVWWLDSDWIKLIGVHPIGIIDSLLTPLIDRNYMLSPSRIHLLIRVSEWVS